MAQGVLIFAEQREGILKPSSLEAATLGRELKKQIGGELSVAIIGANSSSLSSEFKQYGVDKVYLADSEELNQYDGERYTALLAEAVSKAQPSVLIIVASAMGKDIAPRVASSLGAGLATDCTDVEVIDGKIIITRPVYAGKALIRLRIDSDFQILSIRPNVFAKKVEGDTDPEVIDLQIGEKKNPVSEVQHVKSERPELTEASIIVSGGRGMGGPDNFYVTEELADVLGAAVGASRAVVDAGWRPHTEQVGQTGKTVSPNLYIACGISGAIQHLAGMSSSKVIVAINKDAEAPIFKVATYGIVGDLFEVVPKMIEEIKALNS